MEQNFPNVNRASFRAQPNQEPQARKRAKCILATGVRPTRLWHFLGQVFFGFQVLDSVEKAHLAGATVQTTLVSHSTGRQEETRAFPDPIKLDHLICEPRGQKNAKPNPSSHDRDGLPRQQKTTVAIFDRPIP